MPGFVGLSFVLILLALLIAVAGSSRLPWRFRLLICTGLAFRLVGAVAYYVTATAVYGGRADARLYLLRGTEYAKRMWQGDFAMFTQNGDHFWGTNFIDLLTGLTSSIVGSSFIANNLMYSLAAFGGLWAFASAFRRSYPGVPVTKYAQWIWLFPSLWFWPSGIGKEAILISGFGLAINGFIGINRRINWLSFLAGVTLIFLVRPQVMAVIVFSMTFAHWITGGKRWNIGRIIQGLVFLGGALLLIRVALQNVGVEDTQGVTDYVEARASHTAQGHSAVTGVGTGILSVPFAAFNILFRPLPWDVSSGTGALSMIEIYGFWFLAIRRRHNIWNALKHWRSDRLLGTALIFTAMYATILGMVVVNMGIIARQRTCLFPCMFLFFEAMPALKRDKVVNHPRRSLPNERPLEEDFPLVGSHGD